MPRPPKGSIPLPGIRWRGLNLQFFVLIFLPLTIILLIVTFGSLDLHQDAMRSLVGERDERVARTAASALNEQLNHRSLAVRGLALRAADQIDPAQIMRTSDFLEPDFDYGMAIINPDREILAYTGEDALWNNLGPEFEAFLQEAWDNAGQQAVFSPVLSHRIDDDKLVFVAFAPGGDTLLAVGAFSPTRMARRTLTGAFYPGEESGVFLVTPDHQIIYQIGNFSSTEDPENHPGIGEALRGESGTTYVPVENSEHVIAFSPVQPTNWALVIEEPWHSVTSPLLNSTLLAPLVLVPVLLLALIALWFGARQIIRPLQSLETLAADLAWGDFESIQKPVGGIEEITRLQQTLIYLAAKVRRAQTVLRDYIGAITTGQEEERRRLARELHDDTIQSLIALNQRVQLTQLKLAEDPDALSALEEIRDLTESTIQDLRRLVGELRPLYLEDLGLVAALKMLAQETTKSADIPISFSQSGIERRLFPQTELAFYRMAQEGVSNILRHAHATKASLEITFTPQEISLTIADDGRGFKVPESPGEFAPSGHFGLLGIHERAELIGAQFEIHSGKKRGTQLMISLHTAEKQVLHT